MRVGDSTWAESTVTPGARPTTVLPGAEARVGAGQLDVKVVPAGQRGRVDRRDGGLTAAIAMLASVFA